MAIKDTLSKYSLLSAALLGGVSSMGKVIYTDVDPDKTYTQDGDEFELDLNSDGVVDFTIGNSSINFTYYSGALIFDGNIVNMTPASGNGIMGVEDSYQTYSGGYSTGTVLYPMRANQAVSSLNPFITSATNLAIDFKLSYLVFPIFSTNNNPVKDTIYDRFIGLQFQEGPTTLYGWVRVTAKATSNSQQFTVYDYAYETTGEAIPAGYGITSPGTLHSGDLTLEGVEIWAANDQLYVTSEENISGTVSITNVSGATVTSSSMNGNNHRLPVHGHPAGAYVVTIESNDGRRAIEKITL